MNSQPCLNTSSVSLSARPAAKSPYRAQSPHDNKAVNKVQSKIFFVHDQGTQTQPTSTTTLLKNDDDSDIAKHRKPPQLKKRNTSIVGHVSVISRPRERYSDEEGGSSTDSSNQRVI